eukprot:m.485831 g.485831  ORF g.485831 m.485831 type:complete len:104 (-) comp75653_c0_seq1:76-387(-)
MFGSEDGNGMDVSRPNRGGIGASAPAQWHVESVSTTHLGEMLGSTRELCSIAKDDGTPFELADQPEEPLEGIASLAHPSHSGLHDYVIKVNVNRTSVEGNLPI